MLTMKKLENLEFEPVHLKNVLLFILHRNLQKKTQGLTFLGRNLYGRYSHNVKFQNSVYEVHQVGPKDSRSEIFSFLALKAESIG
jgi:hypothetical protein